MQPGDAAEWANVGVTALALFAAGWAALATHRALQLERKRDQRAQEADWSAQAALVAAWPTGVAEQDGDASTWRAVIKNNSGVPVYGVVLTYTGLGDGQVTTHEVGLVPPGTQEVGYPREWTANWPDNRGNAHTMVTMPVVGVNITFTDAAGFVWQRNERGELSLVRGHESQLIKGHPMWPNASRGI